MSALLSPSYLGELDALRRRLLVRARGGGAGEHLAKRKGGSAEFLEHREYVAGDDPRRIDWMAFARTGEPVLKLFRAEEDVVFRLVIDASASLAFGEPTKLEHAKRIAASLGYLALRSSERAQLVVAREGVDQLSEPIRGRAALPKLLRSLDALEAHGRTSLGEALQDVVLRSSRPGLLLVVSDFLDASPFESAIFRAAQSKHDIVLVQVLTKDEIDPPYEGDIAFVDSETDEVVEMTIDDRALALYRASYERLTARLAQTARKIGATYVRTTTDEPALEVMKRVVERGVAT